MGVIRLILIILIVSFTLRAQVDDSLVITYNYINTTPQEANVFLNDTYIGSTPLRFLSGIAHRTTKNIIAIKLKNYFDYSFSFNFSDLPFNKNIKLLPLVEPQSKNDMVQKNSSNFFKPNRELFPIIASGAVTLTSTILSYYFKTKANDMYDEYLNSGETDKLDKTKRYDLYSGIALGIMQVAFVSFIYFLIIQ